MQKTTIGKAAAAALVALLALLAGLAWWFFAAPGAAPALVDRTALVRAHAPSQGRDDAAVVIVEFFDPACGTCRAFYPQVKQLMAQHPERIRLVLRYAPFHKGSDKVVALLEAARRQGKFWPTLEALLDSQDDWAVNHTAQLERAWKHLDGVGLNLEQLAFDMTDPELQRAIAQDLADANTLQVSQTPEYFVNGRPLPSFGFTQLQQLVESELASAR
jgi:protein-disulfide isomerase